MHLCSLKALICRVLFAHPQVPSHVNLVQISLAACAVLGETHFAPVVTNTRPTRTRELTFRIRRPHCRRQQSVSIVTSDADECGLGVVPPVDFAAAGGNDDTAVAGWVPYLLALAVLFVLVLLLVAFVLRNRGEPEDDTLFGPRTPRVMGTEKHYPKDELADHARQPRKLAADVLTSPPPLRRAPYYRHAPPYVRAPEYGNRQGHARAPEYRLPPGYPDVVGGALHGTLPEVPQKRFTKVTTTTTTIIEHGDDAEDAEQWPLLDGDVGAPPPFVPPPEFSVTPHFLNESMLDKSFNDTALEEADFLFSMIDGPKDSPRKTNYLEEGPHASLGTFLDAAALLQTEIETAVGDAGLDLAQAHEHPHGVAGSAIHGTPQSTRAPSHLATRGGASAFGAAHPHGHDSNLLTAAARLGSEIELVVGATDANNDVFLAEEDDRPPSGGGVYRMGALDGELGAAAESWRDEGHSMGARLLAAARQLSDDVEEGVREIGEV